VSTAQAVCLREVARTAVPVSDAPMSDKIRWGILGTGTIAHAFARGLRDAPGAELLAVGSRSQEGADRFGDEFGIPRRHATYADLAADGDVDVVYVSTPHSRHRDDTVLCLRGGRHVLCEKPFALNIGEAEEMVACAREHDRFLMEAMWTRFNPVMVKVRELLAEGAIGEVRMLYADFGFRADFDPAHRLFDPSLGGGALLDVGIYPLALAHMVFGGPAPEADGFASVGSTRVDEQCAWLMRYPNGALAVLSAATRTETSQQATICGTEGMIRIPRFWDARELELNGQKVPVDVVGNAYQYQAIEVMERVRAGDRESGIMSLDMTLAIQRDLDALRSPWGVRYPTDD
jgi:dihydrodiol dehydrogenase / D-xylose 1-dehydrogenase (NADP)